MRFIKLTACDSGQPVYVNPDQIECIVLSAGNCYVCGASMRLWVRETPEEVARIASDLRVMTVEDVR